MRDGAEPTAVRVLPAEGIHPLGGPALREPDERRWPVPLLVVSTALLMFFAATRPPGTPDADAAPTTAVPPLSAVEAETIDLRRPTEGGITKDWETAFESTGGISDVLRFNNTLVSIGWNPAGAQAWLPTPGGIWATVPLLESPENAKTSLDHAVQWDGDIVALGSVDEGVGLWTAGTLSGLVYQGQIEAMDDHGIVDLDAGAELLAVAERDGRLQGWTSPDGLIWTPTGSFQGLDPVNVQSFAATEDWYFVAGSEDCDNQICRPVIYRSKDAINWEPAGGILLPVLSTERGTVRDITATDNGLVAVGWLGSSVGPGTEVAIWTSPDGATWTRLAQNEPLLQPTSATMVLIDLDLRNDPIANVLIDGEPYRFVVDSEVATDAGTFRVTGVGPRRLAVQSRGLATSLLPGEALTINRAAIPSRIATEGPRIVIVGHLVTGARRPVPMIWSSADSGATWELAEPPGFGAADAVAIVRENIAVTGTTLLGDPILWTARWNTDTAEAAGVETLRAFISAINQRDVDAVSALLQRDPNGRATPRLQIPSLGDVPIEWWRDETLRLNTEAIAHAFEYLDSLSTDMSLGHCTVTASLVATDTVRVTCEFQVTSDLLAVLTPTDSLGTIEGVVTGGLLRAVTLPVSPSAPSWLMLAAGTVDATDADRESLVRVDDEGLAELHPTFTRESAATHLRLAKEFVGGLLRPGDIRVVDTPFGTMEWQWLDSVPAPVDALDWITYTESGFFAIGRTDLAAHEQEISLWSSTDGFIWEKLPTPDDIEHMWNLKPFRGGLFAEAFRGEQSLLLLFDGSAWTEVTLPPPEDGSFVSVEHTATSGNELLVFTQVWGTQGPLGQAAWLIGADNRPRRARLPEDLLPIEGPRGLVGTYEGFFLATSPSRGVAEIVIWHSSDGENWTPVAESASIDGALDVWNLQLHHATYFVVGQLLDTMCPVAAESSRICKNPIGLWTSPDGVAWDRVVTKTGEPLDTIEIASGPLGLAAVGDGFSNNNLPTPLYFSPDAEDWESSDGLTLFYPDATSWWTSLPAVGHDTILIPGAARKRSSGGVETDTSFLIIGRVIDG